MFLCSIVWLLSHMALLSWADLSYVLPVTSIAYVLVALVGRFLLHEQVSPARWVGVDADHGGRDAGGPYGPAHARGT